MLMLEICLQHRESPVNDISWNSWNCLNVVAAMGSNWELLQMHYANTNVSMESQIIRIYYCQLDNILRWVSISSHFWYTITPLHWKNNNDVLVVTNDLIFISNTLWDKKFILSFISERVLIGYTSCVRLRWFYQYVAQNKFQSTEDIT